MANAIYPEYKDAIMGGGANTDLLAGNVKVMLVDTGTYTYDAADVFESDITGIVGETANLGTKTLTGGVFDAADTTATAVSGATVEALIVYIDTGTPTTSRVVCYIDTGVTGLPVTPNGGDINIAWNVSGIFAM